MEERIDFQQSLLSIQYHVGIAEQMSCDEMEPTLKELFDEIVETYKDFPGMQCIIASMAMGDIRHMESENSEYAFEIWNKWVDATKLQPWDVPAESLGKASKIVYGREDAFVWQKPH